MLHVIFVDVRAACARVSELGLVGAMPEAVKLAHHVPQRERWIMIFGELFQKRYVDEATVHNGTKIRASILIHKQWYTARIRLHSQD